MLKPQLSYLLPASRQIKTLLQTDSPDGATLLIKFIQTDSPDGAIP